MTPDLIYVSDSQPGISRRRRGRGFSYTAPDGTTIAHGAERDRIEALAVPPAYSDVWICAMPNGHLQATGRDARKRKQYRYHVDWAARQAETKFDLLADFGPRLPRIRARVMRDLTGAEPGTLEYAQAAAVALIDRTALRVGNPSYSAENGSYGALTLRGRHMQLHDDHVQLRFVAKGGKKVRKKITDRKLQRLLQEINDIPGAELLSWVDDDGVARGLSSQQLNTYIADASGSDAVTAKTFRTWAGTLAAFNCAEAGGDTIKARTEAAAKRLHNTPAIARSSYVHPAVIALDPDDIAAIQPVSKSGLLAGEQRLLGLLTSI